jgi:hypothetical protein
MASFSFFRIYIFPILLAVVALLLVAAEVQLRIGRRRTLRRVEKQLDLPNLTMEQFNDRVLQVILHC